MANKILEHPFMVIGGWVILVVIALFQFIPSREANTIEILKMIEANSPEVQEAYQQIADLTSQLEGRGADFRSMAAAWRAVSNTYNYPWWIKRYNGSTGPAPFEFMATNLRYSQVYGTPIDSFGYSDSELYSIATGLPVTSDLFKELKQYSLNDLKVVLAGAGKCVSLDEAVFTVWDVDHLGEHKRVVKCRVDVMGEIFVFGYIEDQTPDKDVFVDFAAAVGKPKFRVVM